jgi:N-methylhydantoinase A/oxoprolinase/acetone carboxylase beta subunit
VTFGDRTWVASVHRRDDLSAGVTHAGPAVICEYSATMVVPPGWIARVERQGGLMLEDRDG